MNFFLKLINWGISSTNRRSEKKSMQMFNMALFTAISICFLLMVFFTINGVYQALVPLIGSSLIYFFCYFLQAQNTQKSLSRLIAIINSSLLTFYVSSITRGAANFQLFYITIFLLIFVLYDQEETFFPYSLLIPVIFFLCGEFTHYHFLEEATIEHIRSLKIVIIAINIFIINSVFFIHVKMTNQFEKESEHYLELLKNNIKAQMHQHKLASLGEMAASISHEVNNPLTIIVGKASILKMHIEEEQYDLENFMKLLTSIEEASMRINHITKTLHTYAKSVDQEVFSSHLLAGIVRDCEMLLKRKFRTNAVSFENNIPKDFSIFCRQSQFMQALYNLFKLSLQKLEDQKVQNESGMWIKIDASLTEHEIQIIIRDNRQGEDSWSLNEDHFNAGHLLESQIAFGVANQIIEEHQGSLILTQSPETGFIISIPVTKTIA